MLTESLLIEQVDFVEVERTFLEGIGRALHGACWEGGKVSLTTAGGGVGGCVTESAHLHWQRSMGMSCCPEQGGKVLLYGTRSYLNSPRRRDGEEPFFEYLLY